MEEVWTVISVFPNLSLPASEHFSGIRLPGVPLRIVSGDDDRVAAFAQSHPNVAHLLRSFRDDQSRVYKPAVLIEEPDSGIPDRLWLRAVTAFRNSVAFAYILLNRARNTRLLNAITPQWSDTFDLFPIRITDHGYVHKISPALMALAHPMEPHLGTHSPHLQLQRDLSLRPDAYLCRTLGQAWEAQYKSTKSKDHHGLALFRSLEVAYQAASIAAKNQASEFDYGVGISLWVSAIEVLAHPGPGGGVSPNTVVDILQNYAWLSPRLRRKAFKSPIKRVKGRVNASSAIYLNMYAARNDYLHGNPVSVSVLRPRLSASRVPLPIAAPLIYRIALAVHLEGRYPRTRSEGGSLWNWEFMDAYYYDRAFANLLGTGDDNAS